MSFQVLKIFYFERLIFFNSRNNKILYITFRIYISFTNSFLEYKKIKLEEAFSHKSNNKPIVK
jgi:hypothetical protein